MKRRLYCLLSGAFFVGSVPLSQLIEIPENRGDEIISRVLVYFVCFIVAFIFFLLEDDAEDKENNDKFNNSLK